MKRKKRQAKGQGRDAAGREERKGVEGEERRQEKGSSRESLRDRGEHSGHPSVCTD